MAAYLIANIRVTDPEAYRQYVRAVPATIEAYGGKYLVRGGAAQKLEGDLEPERLVMLEFESMERAREWWASDAYAALKELRRSASVSSLLLVEGVGP